MTAVQIWVLGQMPAFTLGYFESSYAQERPAEPAPTMMTSVSAYSSRSLKYRLVMARLTCQKNRLGLFPIHGKKAVSMYDAFPQQFALCTMLLSFTWCSVIGSNLKPSKGVSEKAWFRR